MYSTCLFCHASLGANESVEHFPVGRRLAFDAARGRMWAVCVACGRWNLAPIEERWEAIDECERLYRANALRASTDNIGMTRAPDGTDLVRIGAALRPEIAAWRYGRQLQRRYFRNAQWRILGAFGVGVAAGGVIAGGIALPAAMVLAGFGAPLGWALRRAQTVERVRDAGGRALLVSRGDLDSARIQPDGDAWALLLRHRAGTTRLAGADAVRILGRLLVHVNRAGASAYALGEAEARLASAGDAAAFVRQTARALEDEAAQRELARRHRSWWHNDDRDGEDAPALGDVDRFHRLALEMSLHEETERAAMAGDLAALEAAWREAEEVATIADRLLVPVPVSQALERLRR